MSRLSCDLGLVVLISLGGIALAQSQSSRATPLRGGESAHVEGIDRIPHYDWAYDVKVLGNNRNNPAATERAAEGIAHCLATNANGKAGDLLGGPLTDDPKFHRLNGALSGTYRVCATNASNMPLFLINSALAQELLQGAPLPAGPAKPDLHVVAKFFNDPAGITIDSVGRCLAAMSPNLVYQLAGTPVGSPEEKQALEAAYSKTPDCGVPAPPADIPVAEQRSALVTGLYHWVHRGGGTSDRGDP